MTPQGKFALPGIPAPTHVAHYSHDRKRFQRRCDPGSRRPAGMNGHLSKPIDINKLCWQNNSLEYTQKIAKRLAAANTPNTMKSGLPAWGFAALDRILLIIQF